MGSDTVGTHLTGKNLEIGAFQSRGLYPQVEVARIDHLDAVDGAAVSRNVKEITLVGAAVVAGFSLIGLIYIAVGVEYHAASFYGDVSAGDLDTSVEHRAGSKVKNGIVLGDVQNGCVFGLVPALNVDNVGVVLVGQVGLGLVGKDRQN